MRLIQQAEPGRDFGDEHVDIKPIDQVFLEAFNRGVEGYATGWDLALPGGEFTVEYELPIGGLG